MKTKSLGGEFQFKINSFENEEEKENQNHGTICVICIFSYSRSTLNPRKHIINIFFEENE